MNKIVFSGIQPSGSLHIGNYIGAIKQWVDGQNDGQNIFCIVDMHAITVNQDPKVLRENSLNIASILLASGINPDKSLIFIQSQNPDHANFSWVLNCHVSMGQMSRMTQFKEKSDKKDFVSLGLFNYPVLMASDILLYDTTDVPVGEDQKQHVELARDIAQRFNNRYGQTLVLPKSVVAASGSRIMSLIDPSKKMSKSDDNPNSRIELLDDADTVKNKIKKAITGSENSFNIKNPGVKNLVEIYVNVTGANYEQVLREFEGKGYGQFKEAVANSLTLFLSDLQLKYHEYRNSSKLREVLEKSAQKAREISSKKLKEVYLKIGFYE